MSAFTTVDAFYPYRLRGPSLQQSNAGLLFTGPSMRLSGRALSGDPVSQTYFTPGLALKSFALQNRSGATGCIGIGVRIPNEYWIAGQWVDANGATAFTDDTTDAQSAGLSDFPLETVTNNDGFVVACRVPFNAISIDVGTASVGVPVRTVKYSNTAGTGWTTASNLFIQDGSGAVLPITGTTAANEGVIVWSPWVDWGLTGTSGVGGVPQGYYAVLIQATTASSTAALADSLAIFRLNLPTEAVLDNDVWSDSFTAPLMLEPKGDALVALFETASPGNQVNVQVKAYG